MSLSSLIRNPTPVRDRLTSGFPKPLLDGRPGLVTPRECERPALVGTAYDYLLRFHLMREMPFATSDRWVAERALERMAAMGDCPMQHIDDEVFSADVLHYAMDLAIRRSKRALKAFLAGASFSTRLAVLSLYLAYCDEFFRSGRVSEDFCLPPSRSDLADLRKLMAGTDLRLFKATSVCLLNPGFGEGSRLIHGADADLLVDDLLIDVKTSEKFTLNTLAWQ